jgi:hypothetical protein
MTVAMDGNFGLVRKFNAGSSSAPPLFKDVYFVDADESKQFAETYGKDKTSDKVVLIESRDYLAAWQ